MKPSDIPEVGEIWLQGSIAAHDFVPEEFWRADIVNMTEDILPYPRTEAFVFEQNDRLLGFISLGGSHIGCLFVLPENHGRGIGRELLRFAQNKHDRLDLAVYQLNEHATGFYLRHGFRITSDSICEYTGCAEYRMEWTRNDHRGQFTTDASRRLGYEIATLRAGEYEDLCDRVSHHFRLEREGDLIDGLDVLFANYARGTERIELSWDVWTGFNAIALAPDAERLILEIGDYLGKMRDEERKRDAESPKNP